MTDSGRRKTRTLSDLLADFEFLDEWEDRYRYVIELGHSLEPLPDQARRPENKVQGCVSQVWLVSTIASNGQSNIPRLHFAGDSDAHIVRGLIAILVAIYSGRRADEIVATDAHATFNRLGLKDHLTPQRSNGFAAMVERIRSEARMAVAGTPGLH